MMNHRGVGEEVRAAVVQIRRVFAGGRLLDDAILTFLVINAHDCALGLADSRVVDGGFVGGLLGFGTGIFN
jgi:hypothetical protein